MTQTNFNNISLNDNMCKNTKNFALGLKIFSTNIDILNEVKSLKFGKPFSYIEVYVVPGSYNRYSTLFTDIHLPIIIHASHCGHGVNLACEDKKNSNVDLLKDSFKFSDKLKAKWIIIHGGFSGSIDQVISQLRELDNIKLLIENTPIYNLDGNNCVACTPDEINKTLLSSTVGGFVLDIGHAICAANTLDYPWDKYVEQFISLKPTMYHLSDGDIKSQKDMHLNIGKGNYNISDIIKMIPNNSFITLETPRSSKEGLLDSFDDALAIKSICTSLS